MIREFENYSEIELKDITKDTLILLDIDNNIITHKQYILRDGNFVCRDKFFSIIRKVYGEDKVDELWRRSKIKILDDTFHKFFENYKDNCVGLTARRTGRPTEKSDDNIEEKIYHELKDLNIIFEPNAIENKYVKFAVETDSKIEPDIKDFYIMSGPMFKNGIIFTCNYNKGHVLDEFMKIVGRKPDKIYAFDDKKKNLEDVMKYCNDSNISFIGYHNTHYAKHCNELLPYNVRTIMFVQSDYHTKSDADELIDYYDKI